MSMICNLTISRTTLENHASLSWLVIGAWVWHELGSAGRAQSSECHLLSTIAHSVIIAGKQLK
jgi:hypothetical protein